jgi:hypothetical protein
LFPGTREAEYVSTYLFYTVYFWRLNYVKKILGRYSCIHDQLFDEPSTKINNCIVLKLMKKLFI